MSKKQRRENKLKLQLGDIAVTIKDGKMVVKHGESKVVIDETGVNIFAKEKIDIKSGDILFGDRRPNGRSL